MVLEDVTRAIFGNLLLQDMFTGRKPLPLQELREVMLGAVTNPSLKIEASSFDRLFAIACMAMKSNLLRVDSARGMVPLMEEKLTVILEMFSNPQMKVEIERARSAMKVFYGSLSMGGLCRLRCSQLNVLRTLIVPVVTLINEGYQLETGHSVPCKTGPNASELGALRTFNKAGSVSAVNRIPLAGVTVGIAKNQEDAVPNVFDSAREKLMRLQMGPSSLHLHAVEAENLSSERSLVHGFGLATFTGSCVPPSPPPPPSVGGDGL